MPLIEARTKTTMTMVRIVMSKDPIEINGRYKIIDAPLNGGNNTKKKAMYKLDNAVNTLLNITFHNSVSDLSVLIEASLSKILPIERPSLNIICGKNTAR